MTPEKNPNFCKTSDLRPRLFLQTQLLMLVSNFASISYLLLGILDFSSFESPKSRKNPNFCFRPEHPQNGVWASFCPLFRTQNENLVWSDYSRCFGQKLDFSDFQTPKTRTFRRVPTKPTPNSVSWANFTLGQKNLEVVLQYFENLVFFLKKTRFSVTGERHL